MKVCACKKCDICGDIVAKRHNLRYNTCKYYITLRSDSVPWLSEDYTVKGSVHICSDCWLKLKIAVDMVTEEKL